nr:hypothetical protein [uncultured Desulfobacter sp.]
MKRRLKFSQKKRATLDSLAELLQEKEVLSGDEVAKVTKKADNERER